MDESGKRETDYQEELELALKARERFLKDNPDLQSFQDEIDRILEKTIGSENRIKALAFLIETKLYELRDSMAELQTTIKTQYNNVRNADTDVTLDNFHISTDSLN